MPKVRRFTAAEVARLRLPKGNGQIDFFEHVNAGRSLILTFNKSGKRSWSALFYDRGKPRRKKLGEFPEMSCADARKAAIEFNAGKALAGAKAGSFQEVAEKYQKLDVAKRGLRSEREIKRLLERHVYPRWANRRFADIRRGDVADLLDEIEGVEESKVGHGAGVADSVLAVIRALMNWHQARDENYVTPIVPKMRRKEAVKRERWLSDDEIRTLWETCGDAATFGAICRVLLLTGQRREKVRRMRWTDVDLDNGEWRIPREPREKGTPAAITLPTVALEVVADRPRFAENDFVFAGRGKTAFDAFSQSKQRLDAKLGFEQPWRLHDLRRTSRALMTRANVPTEIAELALGHTVKGVQAHYDNPKEYRHRIDDALKAVAREIELILVPGAKIVAFPT